MQRAVRRHEPPAEAPGGQLPRAPRRSPVTGTETILNSGVASPTHTAHLSGLILGVIETMFHVKNYFVAFYSRSTIFAKHLQCSKPNTACFSTHMKGFLVWPEPLTLWSLPLSIVLPAFPRRRLVVRVACGSLFRGVFVARLAVSLK